jgi:hypothetical protein
MAGIKKIAPHIALFNTLDSFANEHQLTEDPYISGLSNAVLNRKNLPMWASLNPLEFLPHAPVNVNKVLQRVQSWMVIARNTLVFLPVALTWLAISKATSAFAVYTSSNTLSVVNFLDFWENGYGVLSKSWSLSTVATFDFQIILIIIALTISVALLDRKLRADLLVQTQAADEDRIRLAIAITSYLFDNQRVSNVTVNAGLARAIRDIQNSTDSLEKSSKELNKTVKSLPTNKDLLSEIKSLKSRSTFSERF